MNISRTNIILIIITVVILAAAAYLLFGRSNTSAALSQGTPASADELTFLGLTAQIEPVKFDASILTDVRFTGLRDIRTEIMPEEKHRFDPFAPLPGVTK